MSNCGVLHCDDALCCAVFVCCGVVLVRFRMGICGVMCCVVRRVVLCVL